MFPDSKIERNVHCNRTKKMSILNKAIALKLKGYLCEFFKVLSYSLVNDGFMTAV